MHYNFENIAILIVFCVGIGIRGIISLSSYSGASTPPLFGDYEAQRHWQEITYNLPAKQWYSNSTENDLLYWGIDYPPLTAYHSHLMGIIANHLNSSYVTLFNSRGIESSKHKSFMRLTVLTADLLIYIPAITFVIISLKSLTSKDYILPSLVLLILYPGQILIDNGHFQYNNISLGLFILCVGCILQKRHNLASLFFSLALNYKQMELYHALPVFVYLLRASCSEKSISKNLFNLIQVACITVTTFLLLWLPWTSSLDSLTTTSLRLFPLNRGVFEDNVANVWCALNVIYKLRVNLQNNQMALICLTATLLAILPTNLNLFFNCKTKTFLYTLVNTSLSFFLLSFQVHEKSILLCAIPACFILKEMPFGVICFLKISILSLFPLLIKDNLSIVYFCMIISYDIIFKYLMQLDYGIKKHSFVLSLAMDILDIIILITSFAILYIPCPTRFPFLWSFAISFFCCIFFILFLFVSNIFQYNYVLTLQKYKFNVKKILNKYI